MTGLSKNYKEVGEVVAEVFKVDNLDKPSGTVTIRVSWYTMPNVSTKGINPNANHWQHGTSTRNPQQMQQHMLQMQQQMQRQAVQQAQKQANAKPQEHHQDYVFPLAEDARLRIKHLPPKSDANGKKVAYSAEELKELKGNIALSGYDRPMDSLKVGSVVEFHLGNMVKAPKDKQDDLYIRWLYVLDETNAKDPPKKTDPVKTPKK